MAVLGYARLNKGRVNAFRLGRYQPWIKVYVNGVDHTLDARIAGASITDELNHAPNTVSLRCDGFTPVQGQEVKIYIGDTTLNYQLFGGHILSVAALYEADKPTNLAWDVSCIDYTWLLNRRKVLKKYTSTSATAIIQDLISTFTSGFTSLNVVAGLAQLDEITFTNEEVGDAITRVMERVGGYWYADYAKDIHAFLTDTETAGAITTASPRGMSDIVQHVDLSQIATRVWARGGGSNAASDVLVGGATLPVEDSSWYDVAGGTVEVGQQRIAYTGIAGVTETGSTTGYVLPPAPAAPGAFYGGSGGSLTTLATYLIAWAYGTSEGVAMTTPSSVTLTGIQQQIQTDTAPIPTDPKVTTKSIYLSTANGAQSTMKKFTDYALSVTGVPTIVIGSAASGINAPTSNTAGMGTEQVAAGSTTLSVEDLSQFAASGWAEVGGMVFSYTGRSGITGPGTLTGIPASGVGSLTAAVRSGTVKSAPHLTGVTGIVYTINKGDPVNIVIGVGDGAAQTALAALVGGDGVHEMFITDGRWSLIEATARANAELTMRKDPLVTVSFKSHDQSLVSGRDVTITLSSPAISGTFKIQRVTFSEIGLGGALNTVYPLRSVECSSRRFSFEDLLRQIRGKAA